MCLGVPGQLVERLPDVDGLERGVVELAGIRRAVCLACVPETKIGEYIIVHAGLAISRIDADEAARLLDHLREMRELEGVDEVP